jgi:hypothetical protein
MNFKATRFGFGRDAFDFFAVAVRVARWFNLKPKIPLWVYFGGPWNAKWRYILRLFGILYERLV